MKEIFITDLHHSFLVAIFTGKALRPEWGQQAELAVFSSCLPFPVGQAKGRATLRYTRVLLKLVCSEQNVEVGSLRRSLQLTWSCDSSFVFMKHPSFPHPTRFLLFFEKRVGLEKEKVDGKKREKGFNSKYPRLYSCNPSVSGRHSWLVFPWSFDIQWGGWLRDPKLALALNCLLEESVCLHWL